MSITANPTIEKRGSSHHIHRFGAPPRPLNGETQPGVASGWQADQTKYSGVLADKAEPETHGGEAVIPQPAYFPDLNLDQIIADITAGREEYELLPYYYTSVRSVSAIRYRHEIFQDLENEATLHIILEFSNAMRDMRKHIAESGKLRYVHQKRRLFLDAVSTYCRSVSLLRSRLACLALRSRGLLMFREFISDYETSSTFTGLIEETDTAYRKLSEVRYCLSISDSGVRARKAAAETDYGREVDRTFEKFKRAAVKSYLVEYHEMLEMNHVEAAVLDLVAKLYPDVFDALGAYCARNRSFADPRITAFDREIQFYVAYLQYLRPLRQASLAFCYPEVSSTDKAIEAADTFDLALANKLLPKGAEVVPNDFQLKDSERIFVVTGANQGGKTTFARLFGQLHHLASIGCPVPGRHARLFLFDRMFTHFEREEDLETLRGKLEDELVRIHDILELATPDSIVVMNEIFTSTTLHDALFLGRRILERIMELDLLGVCVTFVDELASLSRKTVSMVSLVDSQDPSVRTFKIARRPADGLAYAMAIARKYRLTYEDIKKRAAP